MKTLVIHPKDRSTDFLKPVYAHLDATVVTGGVHQDDVRQMVKDHDQVLMLGHGSPSGLMSVGQFDGTGCGYIVDRSFTEALSEKANSVFIWCNADRFVQERRLKGFYTGMFISEVHEAYWNYVDATRDDIEESNDSFARIMGEAMTANPILLHRDTKTRYGKVATRNPVAKYNHDRLYVT